jgi:hypothetical protein
MFLLILFLLSDIPLSPEPVWESIPGFYSTGGGFADLDGDGDFDFFVSNGNDMESEPNHVFLNEDGNLTTTPHWVSNDFHFSGHLAVGDVDRDGYPELAVANYGEAWVWTREVNTFYENIAGTLTTYPVWVSRDSSHSFACGFGDIDGDGDLDLAFACGERYSNQPDHIRIYENTGGVFDTIPFWISENTGFFYDIAFGDINGDGWLDMAVAVDGGSNLIYFNTGGTLETTPSWNSYDSGGTIQIALGDVNGDGWIDMAAADNAQLGGESHVKLYLNLGGNLSATPSWVSVDTNTYFSTVAFGDVDGDGDLDLAAGGWWEPVVVFENIGGTLVDTPSWGWIPSNPYNLVCEKVTFVDLDLNDMEMETTETFLLLQNERVVTLSHLPFNKILEVKLNGSTIPFTSYCESIEEGWISIGGPLPLDTNTVEVTYTYSLDLELSVTNWSPNSGNFVFWNNMVDVREFAIFNPIESYRVLPNVFNEKTLLILNLKEDLYGYRIAIYDVSGRRISSFNLGHLLRGRNRIELNSKLFGKRGIYFIKGDGIRAKVIYMP